MLKNQCHIVTKFFRVHRLRLTEQLPFVAVHTFHLKNVDALCPSCARFGIVVVIPADCIMVLFYAQRGQNAASAVNDQVWFQNAIHPHSTVFILFRVVYQTRGSIYDHDANWGA